MALSVASCSTTYRISTVIERNGSATREFTQKGKVDVESFLFDFGEGWQARVNDSMTIMKKEAATVKELSEGFRFEEYDRPLAAPAESLKKRFRWFYTYYDFEAVYSEIEDKGNVPMGAYLDEEQMALWFRGDMSAYRGLNGVELKEKLDEADEAFWKWFGRSLYEIYFDVVSKFAAQGPYASRLAAEKDKVFETEADDIDPFDFSIDKLCGMFDRRLATDYFSVLYGENKDAIDLESEQRTKAVELFDTEIIYSLTMPGRVISTNAPVSNGGVSEWKVDGWRILASDYTLTARSRTPNYWTWIVTLLAVAALCSLTVRYSRSYRATMRR